jgi:hypothetical protein
MDSRGRRLPVTSVLATTQDGTRRALVVAKRLTEGLEARVVVLVPAVAAHGEAFEPAILIDRHRALAVDVGVHVTVVPCVCRRFDDVLHQIPAESSLLIVGGRKRLWWPSREERLVARLLAEGYAVVFAQVGADRAPAPAWAVAR